MAKSLRSKVKRAHRRGKREEGVFAAAHRARLERLSNKLSENKTQDVCLQNIEPDGELGGWLG